MERYLKLFGTDGSKAGEVYEETEVLSAQEQMEEFMFLGLRKMKGISGTEFEKSFGRTLDEVYGDTIDRLQRQGVIERAGDELRLTERGVDVSNYVFAEFL